MYLASKMSGLTLLYLAGQDEPALLVPPHPAVGDAGVVHLHHQFFTAMQIKIILERTRQLVPLVNKLI
jgi:hypothetical protein